MEKDNIITRPITVRQNRAVDFWIRRGCKSKAEAIREAGYSQSVARQPHKVFESPVVKIELEKRGIIKEELVVENTIKVVEVEEFDVSKIPAKQIDWLKKQLAMLPEIPKRNNQTVQEVEVSSYVPRGTSVDIFNDLPDTGITKYTKTSNYSSV